MAEREFEKAEEAVHKWFDKKVESIKTKDCGKRIVL